MTHAAGDVKEVRGISCPACRSLVSVADGPEMILQFKPIYLRNCDRHSRMWADADRRTRKKMKKEKRGRVRMKRTEK